ncbi:hypothetical protein ATE84_2303 [Aquimarina sp. MAR_2010_214]|uniref:DUF6371 domain-containing protein n=1 Tax=Aquimarina sp. MAR_2010_214 TaxID=1250026 RepID=UPI000C70C2AF|nr:DUF6371 domain-containing protein [Aquimarina sp. MAR_2010_214]PKV50248.1 hypothetical protein ATE84_2303 [Aquimarina sp. MAR_2010_214]
MEYRFTLEPYTSIKSRFSCPNCGKKTVFSRYIDTEDHTYVGEKVGRCNREVKCGYHYTPKQFFEDKSGTEKIFKEKPLVHVKNLKTEKIINTIPKKIMIQSKQKGFANNFVIFLQNIFGEDATEELIKTYHIGTSKLWYGATVFWQVDRLGNIRSGKIMLYNPKTGKRIKQPFSHISWVHKALPVEKYNLKQCLFGEHLIAKELQKPIAIVESEKTAIIASVFLPEFIWIATGSLSNLNYENTKILKGRQAILFPDLGGCTLWKNKIKNLYPEVDYQISDLLEKKSSIHQKKNGWDIADYLINLNI